MQTLIELYVPEHLEQWDCSPTGFDSAANYAGADFGGFYVAPISRNRDTSDALTLSNWGVISEDLDELIEHEDSGATTFGHWACGWYELYLIHGTDTAALKAADQWAASLADYPVASEARLSELEVEQEAEHWENWGLNDWERHLEAALKPFAPDEADHWWASEVLESLPPERVSALFWELGEVEHGSQGPEFRFPELSVEQLANLTGLPLTSNN